MHRGRLAHEGTLSELVTAFPARIAFETDLVTADMPVTPVSVTGDRVVIETRELQDDLYRVLGWAETNAIKLRNLSATTSGLADVFRTLTNDQEVPQ